MAIVLDYDSNVEVAEADAYFSTRLGSEPWFSSDEGTKDSALVTATHMFEELEWAGTPISVDQALAFPRRIVGYTEVTPIRYKRAIMEQALHILVNPELLEDSGSVEDLSVGPIRLTTIRAPKRFPDYVLKLISPFIATSGISEAGTWWRAN